MTDITRFRDLLEMISAGTVPPGWETAAQTLLKNLSQLEPEPEPAWQDGDAVLTPDGEVLTRLPGGKWSGSWSVVHGDDELPAGVDKIVAAGRRVHPARFADHAEQLRDIAAWCAVNVPAERVNMVSTLQAIADDLAGDTDD